MSVTKTQLKDEVKELRFLINKKVSKITEIEDLMRFYGFKIEFQNRRDLVGHYYSLKANRDFERNELNYLISAMEAKKDIIKEIREDELVAKVIKSKLGRTIAKQFIKLY